MQEKKKFYFDFSAREVWFCDASGKMRFFLSPDGKPEAASAVSPAFPAQIDLHVPITPEE